MTLFYEVTSAGSGQFNNHYAVRERVSRKSYCAELGLTWDQASHLCDVFEEIRSRQRTLNLEVA